MYDEQRDISDFHTLENGWWWYSCMAPPVKHGDIKAAIKRNKRENRYIRAMNPLLCDKCGYVWTPIIDRVDDKTSIIHEDLPTRGLKKRTCQFCL
jgi:hypothetical protein